MASDQEEFKDHALSLNTWKDQAAEDYLAKTEGSVPRTQKVPDQKEDDMNHEDDDLGQGKDDLEAIHP